MMTELSKRLNQLLDKKSEKENKKYYITDVAKLFPELTYEGVRKWFVGEAEPKAEYLKRLAEYFEVSIDYLLTGEENLTKEQIIDKIKDEKVNLMFEAGANELSKEGLQSVLDYIKFVKYRDQQENQEKK